MIAEDFHPTETTIVVADSKIGWAKAYKELVSLLAGGQVLLGMSKVREQEKDSKLLVVVRPVRTSC